MDGLRRWNQFEIAIGTSFSPPHFQTRVFKYASQFCHSYCSYHEKSELKELLEKYLIEEQREKIYQNYRLSQQQHRDNQLEFSSDMNRLEEMLND